jgi:hypothetical protein
MNKFIFLFRPSPYMLNNLIHLLCFYLYLGNPVICVQKDFSLFVLSWFRDLFGFDLDHLSL